MTKGKDASLLLYGGFLMQVYKDFFQIFQDFFFTFLDVEFFQIPFYFILVLFPAVMLVRILRRDG